MNWAWLRHCPWLDTRARFVAAVPREGVLLDLGSSDGETLRHIAELRPDLRLYAVDIAGNPETYPPGCRFHRANLEKDPLPWPDNTINAVTCMHLVEHLRGLELLFRETARLLKPGGEVYFETPHSKTVSLPSAKGAFTLNFYDDPTHVRPVEIRFLAEHAREVGLRVISTGTSRNWLFAAAYPLLRFLPPSRKRYTAQVHWIGWSSYLLAKRPS